MQSVQGLPPDVNDKYRNVCVNLAYRGYGNRVANLCKLLHIKRMRLDDAILGLLTRQDIADQGELLSLLRADGFSLTVSTLSRHLKKLQVRKEDGRYQPASRHEPRTGTPRFTLRKVPPCLLVLRTSPGFANAMALALDGGDLPALAGTIAGDDTIFAAPIRAELLDQLEAEIVERLGRGF